MLKAAIPGCSRLDWTGEAALECEIKVNLGVMQPTFTGDLELRDVVPAERYTLAGRGRGGLLGKAEAAADIVAARRARRHRTRPSPPMVAPMAAS